MAYMWNKKQRILINRNPLESFKCKWWYFDSFGVKHIPEEIEKFAGNKNIAANIYRIQDNGLVMSGYFCIEFCWFYF